MNAHWTLEEALAVIRVLREAVQPVGWCVGMTGSVLYNAPAGQGSDLDLIFYPSSSKNADVPLLRAALIPAGLVPWMTTEEVRMEWRRKGSSDTKDVSVWLYNGKRIDVFVLR